MPAFLGEEGKSKEPGAFSLLGIFDTKIPTQETQNHSKVLPYTLELRCVNLHIPNPSSSF